MKDLKYKAAKAAMIGGIGAMGIWGVEDNLKNYDKANIQNVKTIGNEKFKQYSLYASGKSFRLNVGEDGIISAYWTTKSGKSTIHHTCVTLPDNKIKQFWYDTRIFDAGVYASYKKFEGSTLIKLEDLDLIKSTPTYDIYSGKFFSSIDHIIVNKGYKEGEEFKISDDKIGAYWTCGEIDYNVYIFGLKSLGKGDFEGGGAGSGF